MEASLNHSAQQHAANLHNLLAQQPTATWASAAVLSELQALSTANNLLTSSQQSEDMEDQSGACRKRQQLMNDMLQLLDQSAQALRTQLDDCHRILKVKPCMQDPNMIIRYAHTLRHAFAPLGKAPGLPQLPPAPQLPSMIYSTLRTYNMELAKQQQQLLPAGQQAAAARQALQPDQQQPAAGAEALAQQQQQEAATEAAAAAAAVPAIQFMLNADLLEDELGSQVEEDFSEDDYSDD